MNILQKIAASTRERVERLKKIKPPKIIREEALSLCMNKEAFSFERALKRDDISFICEVKKASPSKGIIAEEFPYLKIAADYEAAGAAALSVLTEPEYFLGNDEYLKEIAARVKIPVLRKDFTVDAYQIYEAKVLGASAVLLICSLLETDILREYILNADSLGLSCLVETHDEDEVKSAITAGARIIGVNNRDLKSFTVDINNSVKLRPLVPDNIIFVSESGIKTPEDVSLLRRIKADAALIGEAFMRRDDKAEALAELRGTVWQR